MESQGVCCKIDSIQKCFRRASRALLYPSDLAASTPQNKPLPFSWSTRICPNPLLLKLAIPFIVPEKQKAALTAIFRQVRASVYLLQKQSKGCPLWWTPALPSKVITPGKAGGLCKP